MPIVCADNVDSVAALFIVQPVAPKRGGFQRYDVEYRLKLRHKTRLYYCSVNFAIIASCWLVAYFAACWSGVQSQKYNKLSVVNMKCFY